MKRSLLLLALIICFTPGFSQKTVDALFSKYSGKDGFVTITVSGDLLRFASCIDAEHENHSSLPANLTVIRILTQEDKSNHADNFNETVIKDLDLDDYEEFMRIKESDQDLRMLVRSEGKTFKEFLLIAGGEDNALIQIKGNMSFEEAKKFSRDVRKNNGLKIEND